jgi:hypothetical protein
MFDIHVLLMCATTLAADVRARIDAPLSAAMQAVVSGSALDVHQVLTLGSKDEPPAWRADHARLGLGATFSREGVSIEVADPNGNEAELQLQLEAWGHPSTLVPLEAAELSARGASIVLERGAVLEWYVNGIDGLQQGFTVLERPPAGDSGDGLELRMRLESELTLEQRGQRDLVLRDACGAARVEFAGLRSWDATGRELDTHDCAAGGWLSILVDSSAATFPITIDPLVTTFEAKLVPPFGAAVKWLGTRVDIDGDTAVAVGVQSTALAARPGLRLRARRNGVEPPGGRVEPRDVR